MKCNRWRTAARLRSRQRTERTRHHSDRRGNRRTIPFRLSDGIRFINIRLLKPGSFRKRTTGFFTAYRSLSRLLRSEPCDLIHSHKRYSDLLGRLLSRRFHIPHTSTCHNIFKHSICTSHFPHSVIAPSKRRCRLAPAILRPTPEIKLINLGILPLRVYSAEEIARRRREMGIDSMQRSSQVSDS